MPVLTNSSVTARLTSEHTGGRGLPGFVRFFQQEPTWHSALVLAAGLLLARIAAGYYQFFWEEDELAIAAGVAALVRDSIGSGLYRYGPQLGYYRFAEWVDVVLGAHIHFIPYILKTISAVSGALIPVLGLFSFRHSLTSVERWILAAMLASNPIIWMSARYGNSAMLQTALAAGSLFLLSNRPRTTKEIFGLVLFGLAVLVRADAVFLTPAIALLVWWNHPTNRLRAVTRIAAFGFTMAVIYAALIGFDPRMDNIADATATHFNGRFPTMFWEYLIWAVSPIPLLLSSLGAANLLKTRPRLLAFAATWCVFPCAFYYPSLTTPRYFLLPSLALAMLSAVGAVDLAQAGSRMMRGALAWGAVAALTVVHLFVGLGHFTSVTEALLGDATFDTHDGPMPTGAFLYSTYNPGGTFLKDVRFTTFGENHMDGVGFPALFQELRSAGREGRTAVVLLDTWFQHGFHYYAQLEGATYLSKQPGVEFASETWLQLGDLKIMTVRNQKQYYEKTSDFRLKAGDLIYQMRGNPFPSAWVNSKLGDGAIVRPTTPAPHSSLSEVKAIGSGEPFVRVFEVASVEENGGAAR